MSPSSGLRPGTWIGTADLSDVREEGIEMDAGI